MNDFREYLDEQLKNPEFQKEWNRKKRTLSKVIMFAFEFYLSNKSV